MGGEQRKFPRSKAGVEIRWRKIASFGEKAGQCFAHSKDVSLGGVCLMVTEVLRQGDLLYLDVKLPGQSTLYLQGKVVRVNWDAPYVPGKEKKCEVGVQFMDLKEESQKQIKDFLQAYPAEKS